MDWTQELDIRGNIDAYHYVVQKDMDGGDTALHEGHLIAAAAFQHKEGLISTEQYDKLRTRAADRFSRLISKNGLIRRHPDTSQWYGDWDRGSRDQYHAVIGLYAAGLVAQARKLLWGHMLRCMLFTSNIRDNSDPGKVKLPDGTALGFLAYYIRGEALNGNKFATLLYPVLLIADLSLLVNSAIRVYYFGNKPEDTDLRNHVMALTLAYYSMPTPVSQLAINMMKKLPKKMNPDSDVNAVQQELNDYYKSNNGVDLLAEIWQPIVQKVIYEVK